MEMEKYQKKKIFSKVLIGSYIGRIKKERNKRNVKLSIFHIVLDLNEVHN